MKQALVKEAKRLGFKEGVNIGNFNKIIKSNSYQFNLGSNILYVGTCCVFENGIWATIVETITKKQAEKELGKKIIG